MHPTSGGCTLHFATLVTDRAAREDLVLQFEDVLWRQLTACFSMPRLAELVGVFEICDCWKYGDAPIADIGRSIFLWQTRFDGHEPHGHGIRNACPVDVELFAAQQSATVTVLQLEKGNRFRDPLFGTTPLEFDSGFPHPLGEKARPQETFLVRYVRFRNRIFLDRLGVSDRILDARCLGAVEDLLRQAKVSIGHPDFAWELLRAWMSVAWEEMFRQVGIVPGSQTRH